MRSLPLPFDLANYQNLRVHYKGHVRSLKGTSTKGTEEHSGPRFSLTAGTSYSSFKQNTFAISGSGVGSLPQLNCSEGLMRLTSRCQPAASSPETGQRCASKSTQVVSRIHFCGCRTEALLAWTRDPSAALKSVPHGPLHLSWKMSLCQNPLTLKISDFPSRNQQENPLCF